MLIDEIIEFKLMGSAPLAVRVHALLTLVIFMTKENSLRKIFEWNIV